jgi:hypothetical protein
MIVGMQTLTDASIRIEQTSELKRQGSITLQTPKGMLATNVIDSQIGVKVQGGGANEQNQKLKYKATNEQVYAVQFQKVKFDWHSSRSVDTAHLLWWMTPENLVWIKLVLLPHPRSIKESSASAHYVLLMSLRSLM